MKTAASIAFGLVVGFSAGIVVSDYFGKIYWEGKLNQLEARLFSEFQEGVKFGGNAIQETFSLGLQRDKDEILVRAFELRSLEK